MIPPVAHPDGADVGAVASYVATCARGWEPGARLLGDARAEDIARMAEWAMAVAPLVEKLRVLGVAVASDYRPTCESAPYGSGCVGAVADDLEFWRAAFDLIEADASVRGVP